MLQAVVSRSVDMLLYCANFTGIVLYVYLQHWARVSWRGSAILPSPATVGGQLTSTIFPPTVSFHAKFGRGPLTSPYIYIFPQQQLRMQFGHHL